MKRTGSPVRVLEEHGPNGRASARPRAMFRLHNHSSFAAVRRNRLPEKPVTITGADQREAIVKN